MKIGIGLPNAIPGCTGDDIVGWATAAEAAGFSSLGSVDRLVYPNLEPLTTFAAAAAVTNRIELVTAILITPNRPNTALLAKQAATIDVLSGGRLTLGVAIGSRDDDYSAGDVPTKGRGDRLVRQVDEMKAIWAGVDIRNVGSVGPAPARPGGPPVLFGGRDATSVARAARHGDGWIAGGTGPGLFTQLAEMARGVWADAGRSDALDLRAIAYFALGEAPDELAHTYLTKGYYAFMGPMAERVAAGAAKGADAVRQFVEAYAQAGCSELIFMPCSADRRQLDELAALLP